MKAISVEGLEKSLSNIIGSSPDSIIYKGTMKDGPEIGVTSLCITEDQWTSYLDSYFQAQVADLARINHENTAKLLGYCIESDPFSRILVFEYASNGTLYEHLHYGEGYQLSWFRRMKIDIGIARGLRYLRPLLHLIRSISLMLFSRHDHRFKMWHSQLLLLSIAILLLATSIHAFEDSMSVDATFKSSVFLSPPFFQRPGSVVNKFYYDISFPRGHIAVKGFDAEVVDEKGIPVPLHETYLHHWVVEPYYGQKGAVALREATAREADLSKFILARNAGICKGTLGQYFGLGSKTRRTSTWVPSPYGIEVGNPEEIPDGYEERWLLNVHAIDTRGVEDRLGCTECVCSLYNVTEDGNGHPLRKDYDGGLKCCHDQTQCRLSKGFKGVERKLYLRYTVKWVDMDDTIVPVKIYIFDITDTAGLSNRTTEDSARPSCKVEYSVKACGIEEGRTNGECVHTKKMRPVIPRGGDIVYGVAHQHSGGIGSALYGQDGRVLCASFPTYGQGKEVGNEAGYIVGMSTCYPKPGSVSVADGELLTLVSNYSSTRQHTGVMGLFYILVADPRPKPEPLLHYSPTVSLAKELWKHAWGFVLMGGIAAVAMEVRRRRRSHEGEEGYQSLVIT